MVLSVKTNKMGKRPLRCFSQKKIESIGKPSLLHLRENLLDESSDSGLGSDIYCGLSLPGSDNSSDIDCSDSADSCLSGLSSSSSTCLPPLRGRPTQVSSDHRTPVPSNPTTAHHLDSSLARSLDAKMHIQQNGARSGIVVTATKRSDSLVSATSSDLPCAKRRKMAPSGGAQLPAVAANDGSHRPGVREHLLAFSKGSAAPGVLTEAAVSTNAAVKHAPRSSFECNGSSGEDGAAWPSARDAFALRVSQNNPAMGTERIAALLSASGNNSALARKRVLKRPSLHLCFPSRSRDGKVELCILVQPEEQHRARYMTEGSRGSIKDDKGTGFPTVKLVGYNQPVVLQVFIGSDQGKVQPHLFYQACKVTGKNCTPCNESVIEGTCAIEINMMPENDSTVSCDCIGILKERNVDVEQRLPYFGLVRCKKRSTKCRIVFRVNLPLPNGGFETLQVASSQILCTQSPGLPEICKKSLAVSPVKGGSDLFIIGKNFQKDAKVVFQELNEGGCGRGYERPSWEEVVVPEKEFLHQSHLVCSIPAYRDQGVSHPVKVYLTVQSGGKSSEPHTFTYTPSKKVLEETLQCKSTQHSKASSHDAVKLPLDRGYGDLRQMSPPINSLTGYDVPLVAQGRSQLESLLKPDLPLCRRRPSMSPTSPLRHMFTVPSSMGSADLVNGDGVVVHLKQEFPPASEDQLLPLSPPPSAHSPPGGAMIDSLQSMAEARAEQASLMSGISQLASEIVEAQEAEAKSRLSEMAADVANNFVSMSEPQRSPLEIANGGFLNNANGCSSSSLETTAHNEPVVSATFHSETMPSVYSVATTESDHRTTSEMSNVSMGLAQLLPADVSCLDHPSSAGAAMDAFMANLTPVSLAEQRGGITATTCPEAMFAGSVEVAVANVHGHDIGTVDSGLARSKVDTCSLHQNFLVSDPCSSLQTTSSYTTQTTSTVDRIVSTTEASEFPSLGQSVTADTASPSTNGQSHQLHSSVAVMATVTSTTTSTPSVGVVVKCEPPTGPQVAPGQFGNGGTSTSAADLNCFQQSMTMTLSQMSDADLLSIINPSTFLTM